MEFINSICKEIEAEAEIPVYIKQALVNLGLVDYTACGLVTKDKFPTFMAKLIFQVLINKLNKLLIMT